MMSFSSFVRCFKLSGIVSVMIWMIQRETSYELAHFLGFCRSAPNLSSSSDDQFLMEWSLWMRHWYHHFVSFVGCNPPSVVNVFGKGDFLVNVLGKTMEIQIAKFVADLKLVDVDTKLVASHPERNVITCRAWKSAVNLLWLVIELWILPVSGKTKLVGKIFLSPRTEANNLSSWDEDVQILVAML